MGAAVVAMGLVGCADLDPMAGRWTVTSWDAAMDSACVEERAEWAPVPGWTEVRVSGTAEGERALVAFPPTDDDRRFSALGVGPAATPWEVSLTEDDPADAAWPEWGYGFAGASLRVEVDGDTLSGELAIPATDSGPQCAGTVAWVAERTGALAPAPEAPGGTWLVRAWPPGGAEPQGTPLRVVLGELDAQTPAWDGIDGELDGTRFTGERNFDGVGAAGGDGWERVELELEPDGGSGEYERQVWWFDTDERWTEAWELVALDGDLLAH